MYVAHTVEIFREVRRVLRDDGTVWLNLGSSFFAKNTAKSVEQAGRSAVMGDANEVFALRDGLSPDDVAYVLSELARFTKSGEITEPDNAVSINQAVARLTK
jgi:spermidine synthase